MGLAYESSDIEVPDKVYHKLGIRVALVLVVLVLIGAMQSGALFVGALATLAAVGVGIAVEVPMRTRRQARVVATELERWPAGTEVVCRVAKGDPRAQLTKDVTTLTVGDAGFSFYAPGTGEEEGAAWRAGWEEIAHLSLRLIPDQPLTGVLEIETGEAVSYFSVYEWGTLSAYLRKRIGAPSEWET
jgi:hypothetical protein